MGGRPRYRRECRKRGHKEGWVEVLVSNLLTRGRPRVGDCREGRRARISVLVGVKFNRNSISTHMSQ